jgi:hypothetical protein
MRVRLRSAWAAGVLVLALALSGCSTTIEGTPSAYRFGDAAGKELILLVPAGVGDEVATAQVTRQDDRAVQVGVSLRQGDTNRPGLEITLHARVLLEAPLGDRKVLDQQGHEIPRTQ